MGGFGIDPIIRGQTAGQLDILIEGAYALGGCPDRMDPPTVYVDLDNYDSVTVIKGSQTVRYGGGTGGTVLFERDTPRFDPGEVFRAWFTGGLTDNSHTAKLGADVAVGIPEGYALATGQYRAADNYNDGNGNAVPGAYDNEGAGLSLGLTPNDDTHPVLSYDYTHDRDVLSAGAGMDGIYSDNDQWRLRLGQDIPLGPFAAVKAELYSVSVDQLMDNYSLRPLTAMFKMRAPSTADTTGERLTADLEAIGMNWTLGTDYLQVDRDATRLWSYQSAAVNVPNSYLWPDVVNADLGIFVEIERPLTKQSRLTAGLRYDRTEARVSQSRAALVPVGPAWVRSADQLYRAYYGVGAEHRDADNLGGFLTYAHNLNDGLAVSVGVTRILRSADPTERYIASNAAPSTVASNQRWVGNPGPDPETHHQIGMTLAKVAKHWNTQLDLFYDRVHDYILRDRARGQPGILLADGTFIYSECRCRAHRRRVDRLDRICPPLASRRLAGLRLRPKSHRLHTHRPNPTARRHRQPRLSGGTLVPRQQAELERHPGPRGRRPTLRKRPGHRPYGRLVDPRSLWSGADHQARDTQRRPGQSLRSRLLLCRESRERRSVQPGSGAGQRAWTAAVGAGVA